MFILGLVYENTLTHTYTQIEIIQWNYWMNNSRPTGSIAFTVLNIYSSIPKLMNKLCFINQILNVHTPFSIYTYEYTYITTAIANKMHKLHSRLHKCIWITSVTQNCILMHSATAFFVKMRATLLVRTKTVYLEAGFINLVRVEQWISAWMWLCVIHVDGSCA